MNIARENLLLAALSSESRDLLLSHSTTVRLGISSAFFEAQEAPQFAYFLTSGVASIVTTTSKGGTTEVGIVGLEGVLGAFDLLGPARMPTRFFVHMEATGWQIPLTDLRKAFRSSLEIHDRILEFVQQQALSLAQIAGCNRLHQGEQRLARWLLMAQDRSHMDVLDITQQFLAFMLGYQRTTVTTTAGVLQSAGLIEYHRGRLKIIDREGLENAACECYQVTKQLHDSLYKEPSPTWEIKT